MKISSHPPVDLTKPSLAGLAYLLRHREAWPSDFSWDYSCLLEEDDCGTLGCAVGLAKVVWSEWFVRSLAPWMLEQSFRVYFRLSEDTYLRLFIISQPEYGCRHEQVTPLMVADAIDRYLGRQ